MKLEVNRCSLIMKPEGKPLVSEHAVVAAAGREDYTLKRSKDFCLEQSSSQRQNPVVAA